MNQSSSYVQARILLGIFGLLITGIGLWIGQYVIERSERVPFGIYAALIAVVLGALIVYLAYAPDKVR
ncbi:hypothetical protein [Haladaptatus halobius]|uniref:hypothetical protein n=1 Tax=Haladaptatus halobius TaxID=2884875 RepID=UPI001D0A626F|nr:hypothetical protein [Haladaptatus halobius]